MTPAEPKLAGSVSLRVVGRLIWAFLWWAIAIGAIWRLARVPF